MYQFGVKSAEPLGVLEGQVTSSVHVVLGQIGEALNKFFTFFSVEPVEKSQFRHSHTKQSAVVMFFGVMFYFWIPGVGIYQTSW